jgi:hypothetical protein
VFARSNVESAGCTKRDPTKPGATSATECCWTATDYGSSGRITKVSSICQTCEYDGSGKKIDCRNTSGKTLGLGFRPPSAGVEQPPPSTSQTTTCPDRSAPDAIGNCAATTNQKTQTPTLSGTDNQGQLDSNSNNNPPSDHHKSKHSHDTGNNNK